MKQLLLLLLVIWSFGGAIFYLFTHFKVRKQPQKTVLRLIAGPLFWFFAAIFAVLDYISEKVFEPIYKWLTE